MQDAVDDVVKRVHRAMDEVEGMTKAGNKNVTRVEINAGGVGVWIATTACLVSMAVSLFLALWVLDLSRKVDDLSDYLSAIYMQAPYLKPKESE